MLLNHWCKALMLTFIQLLDTTAYFLFIPCSLQIIFVIFCRSCRHFYSVITHQHYLSMENSTHETVGKDILLLWFEENRIFWSHLFCYFWCLSMIRNRNNTRFLVSLSTRNGLHMSRNKIFLINCTRYIRLYLRHIRNYDLEFLIYCMV